MTLTQLKLTTLTALVAASLSFNVWADGLTARINSQHLAQGDSFQLTLTTQAGVTSTPDLTPLQKDFQILGTSRSSQTRIINGKRSDTLSWILTLAPKRQGKLTIPAIHAGALSSHALEVNVTDVSQTPKAMGASGIKLSVDIKAEDYYLFQEIPIKVRIETSARLKSAQLIEPQSSEFELSQLGEDKVSQMTRNGVPVNVIERSYTLSPQVSGTLTLPPFVLEGSVIDGSQSRDPFFSQFGIDDSFFDGFGMDSMFNRGKPFRVRSDAHQLKVQGKASSKNNLWFLPAKAVELKSSWVDKDPVFKKEKPITRRISILALGAKPEQIPELKLDSNEDVKIYLDDSSAALMQTDQGNVASKELLVSVVPLKAGNLSLPEIRLNWFNTTKGETETAVIPATEINVIGSNASLTAAKDSTEQRNQASQTLSEPKAVAQSETTTQSEASASWQLYVMFSAMLAAFLIWLWRTRQAPSLEEVDSQAPETFTQNSKAVNKKQGTTGVESQAESTKPAEQLTLLIKQLKSANAEQSYELLSAWLRSEQSMNQHPKLAAELKQLEQVLYAKQQSPAQWSNKTLLAVLTEIKAELEAQPTHQVLPPLYPTH